MSLHWLPINAHIYFKHSVSVTHSHSSFVSILLTCLIYSQFTHQKVICAVCLTIEFYIFINCKQKHLGIAHFFTAYTVQNSLPTEIIHMDSSKKSWLSLKTHIIRLTPGYFVDLDMNHYVRYLGETIKQ